MSGDALLQAIRTARQRKAKADHDRRLLLAYAREPAMSDRTGWPTWPTPRACPYPTSVPATAGLIPGQAAQAIGADGHRHIQQVVTNLLAHEERHTAPGPRITAA
jgi:hypothetical protein